MIAHKKYDYYSRVLEFKNFDADKEYICHACGNPISIGQPMVQRLLAPNTPPMLYMHDFVGVKRTSEILKCAEIKKGLA